MGLFCLTDSKIYKMRAQTLIDVAGRIDIETTKTLPRYSTAADNLTPSRLCHGSAIVYMKCLYHHYFFNNPSWNRHLTVVEGFGCPNDPRSYVVGGYMPLVGSLKANCS